MQKPAEAGRSTINKVKMTDHDHDAIHTVPMLTPIPPSIGLPTANDAESPAPHDDTVLAKSSVTFAAVNTAALYDLDLDANTSVGANTPAEDFGANISAGAALPSGKKDANTRATADIQAEDEHMLNGSDNEDGDFDPDADMEENTDDTGMDEVEHSDEDNSEEEEKNNSILVHMYHR